MDKKKYITLTEEELEIENYLDMQVAVRDYDGEFIHNDEILVFLSDSAVDKWADENGFYEIDELPIKIVTFGAVVDYAAKVNATLVLSGFYSEDCAIYGKDLKIAGEIANTHALLVSARNDEKAAAKKLRSKTVYIHGTLPTDYKKGDKFGVETMKMEKDGKEYTAVPVFINERSAKKNNKNEAPISECKLCDVAFMYRTLFKIYFEPFSRYGYEFEADDIL